MSRTAARETAMKYIYSLDMNKDWDGEIEAVDEDSEFARQAEEDGDSVEGKDFDYINSVISGVKENLEEIDSLIDANTKSWKLSRISKIDLSIMRIAVYEILYIEDIPHQVSINEAVRLAKKFGSADSSKFINGILGGIVRGLGIN